MDKRDYEEPRCPMDNSMWVKKNVTPIPVDRVIAREDEYLGKDDYEAAERHLLYWWQEAEQGNDDRGKLLLCNELMGLYRKRGNGDKAKMYSAMALQLTEELELGDSVTGATAYLNSGTVYKAFGEPEKSLEYFEKAREVYEKESGAESRKAGLYNNMALTLTDLGRFSEAQELYRAAIRLVGNISKPDEAITWLNLADCVSDELGPEEAEEEIREYIDRAESLLDSIPAGEQDSYYAYVCEKCAPVFDYYGYFFSAEKFRDRAEAIYRRNREK